VQKIPTLYLRDKSNPKRVTREVDPDCKWVLDGEGVATQKFDGSACLVRGGRLYRRLHLKSGRDAPEGWIHWTFNPDQRSGHGWAPVTDATADQYHREAMDEWEAIAEGTYELVGPKSNGNPHRFDPEERHELWRHGSVEYLDVPTGFDDLREWLADTGPMEGLVWHHPDGRMAKIKRRDFGLPWPAPQQ
jgi:hypothetical protein